VAPLGIPKLYPALPDDALAPESAIAPQGRSFAEVLAETFGGAGSALERADSSEHAFAVGRGSLQAMVLDRAQADVALALASTAAARTAQALTTILGMAV